jgi:predicted transcriptional regulator
MLLSVKPRHAEAILDGRKTIELRRRAPRVSEISLVLLYSSSPVKAVTGVAKVRAIHQGSPRALWGEYGRGSALSKEYFLCYFEGLDVGHVIELSDVVRFDQPVSLAELRSSYELEPPQSWRYVTSAVATDLAERGTSEKPGIA